MKYNPLSSHELMNKSFEDAVRRMLQNMEVPNGDMDNSVKRFTQNKDLIKFRNAYGADVIISSNSENVNRRNMKLLFSEISGATSSLKEIVDNFNSSVEGKLNQLVRKVDQLTALLLEDEARIMDGYNVCHLNNFSRGIDVGSNIENLSTQEDPKTGWAFLRENVCNVISQEGITFPIRRDEIISPKEIKVVGESTWGLVKLDNYQDDPNVLLRGKPFKYVVAVDSKLKKNKMRRRLNQRVGLEFTFNNSVLVNYIELELLSSVKMRVESISSINEFGFEEYINFEETKSKLSYKIIVEPMRVSKLIIKFKIRNPSGNGLLYDDVKEGILNEVLKDSGFSQRVSNERMREGLIYDFSLKSIKFFSRSYETLGVYEGIELETVSPVGISLDREISKLALHSGGHSYGDSIDGVPRIESYVKVSLNKDGSSFYEELLPLLDGRGLQKEIVPTVNGLAHIKLFPNINKSLVKKYCSCEHVSSNVFTVTLEETLPTLEAASIGVWTSNSNREVVIRSPLGHMIGNGISSWMKINDTTIKVKAKSGTYTDTSDFDQTSSPKPYILFRSDQTAPISLEDKDGSLSIGTDYSISIDNGQTYIKYFPYGEQLNDVCAGDFIIKMTSPDLSAFLKVTYTPLQNQFLDKVKIARMKNGRIWFGNKAKGCSAIIRPVFILRSESKTPYWTPLLRTYTLKVRSNEQ